MSALNARNNARLREVAAVSLLQRIAAVANEASDLREAIQVALEEVCAHTGWPVGHAYLPVGEHSDEMYPTGIWHLDDPVRFETFRRVTETMPLHSGRGLPGRILASGKPAWITDVMADPNFPRARMAADLGVKGAFGFPMLASDRVVGVLEFFSDAAEPPDAKLLDVMTYVGTQLGRVAEREAAEAALVAQVSHTRLLIDSAYDAFVSIDGEGAITGWNAAAESMFGWSRDEAVGRALADTIVPPGNRHAHVNGIRRFLATGEGPILNQRLELTALRRDGHEFPVELAVWPVQEAGGYTFSAFIRDITERKVAEHSIASLAATVESSEDAMVAKSMDGTILSWNRGAERLYGYRPEEAIGRSISIIFPHDRLAEMSVILDRLREGESLVHYETVRLAKDGRLVDVSLTISPILDASKQVVGAAEIARDVGEQRRAERRLRESERQLVTAQQISGIGSWEWDVDRDAITWSEQLYRNFGISAGEFVPSFEGYLALVHPDDREHVRAVVGTALATLEPFRFEHRGTGRDGTARVYLCTGEAFAADGQPVRLAGTNEDITDAKRAELAQHEAFERERRTVAKLRELDQAKTIFTSSVSHELRTPLTTIIGYLELVRDGDGDGDGLTQTQQEMLAVVDRSSRRLLELIEDLLTFSRLQAGTFQPSIAAVSVAGLFASAREAVLPQAATRTLDLRFDPVEGLSIAGDGAQLERVLLNLLSNAIKFTPPGGSVHVEAAAHGDTVSISVSDTGIGVPADEIPRLFSPFFRSSNAERGAIPGTGLGLAIVKAIVEGHGGTIEVESEEGRGTTVSVRLPAGAPVSLAQGA